MSRDAVWSPQCSCSAFFPTTDALDRHLEENRSQERYLLSQKTFLDTQLEKCRFHSRANDKVGQSSDDENGGQKDSDSKHCCPRKKCNRNTRPFQSRQALRVHYQQHVECDEHQNTSETKAIFMNKMRNDLSELSDKQLVLDETREAETRKRARNDTDPNLRETRKSRLDVDAAITSPSHSLHHGNIDPFQTPPLLERDAAAPPRFSSATASTPEPNVEKPIGNLEMIPEGLYSGSLVGVGSALDGFDASVHQLVNFPESWRRDAAYL